MLRVCVCFSQLQKTLLVEELNFTTDPYLIYYMLLEDQCCSFLGRGSFTWVCAQVIKGKCIFGTANIQICHSLHQATYQSPFVDSTKVGVLGIEYNLFSIMRHQVVIITCNFQVKLFGFVNCLGKLLSLFGYIFDNLRKRSSQWTGMCKCGGEMVNYLLVLCLIASGLWDDPLFLRFLVFNELCLKKWLRCIPFEEVLLVGIEAVVFGKWPHFALC